MTELRKQWAPRRIGFWLGAAALLLLLVLLTASPESPAARFLRQDSTWRAMEQRGNWRIGLDPSFPPFETLDAAGQPVGYDIDLARQIAAQWNMEIEIVALGFDSLLDALMAGKIDSIVSALPYDPRLTKDVAYSAPYFEAGLRLAVPIGSPITGVEDLGGKTVAVEWGSIGDMTGRHLQRAGTAIELTSFDTPQEAVDALVAATVDALLIDGVTLRLAQGKGAAVVAVGPVLESSPYVIAMPRRADELQRKVADALKSLQTTGINTAVEEAWFGSQQSRSTQQP